jgi:hypothetical protein
MVRPEIRSRASQAGSGRTVLDSGRGRRPGWSSSVSEGLSAQSSGQGGVSRLRRFNESYSVAATASGVMTYMSMGPKCSLPFETL